MKGSPKKFLATIIPLQGEIQRSQAGRIYALAGFEDNERPAVKAMVEAIGAKCSPYLAAHNHLLIAKGSDRPVQFEGEGSDRAMGGIGTTWYIQSISKCSGTELCLPFKTIILV